MYFPKVTNEKLNNNIPQMRSQAMQKPFFFGGSQTPITLGLTQGSFSGSGMMPSSSFPKTIRSVVMKRKGLEGRPIMPSISR